ncbi:MAG: ATP-binding protein [Granulosicoccus sp.]
MKDSELSLLDRIPIPLFVLEASSEGDITYLFFNKTARNIANFSLSDFVGLNATHLYHAEYGELAYKKHTECYLTAKPISYVLPLPLNGKLRSIRTSLSPILDSNGLVKRIIGASTEISAEIELEEIRPESRSMENELQEFIYLAAHNLRSPMKKVHALADMLREDFDDRGDEKLELIDRLENVATESMTMIQRLLRHAENTRIKASIKHMDLPELGNSILATLDPARLHKCRVDDCSIYADQVLLQTILQNLIDNSIKHNTHGPVSLDITAKNLSPGLFSMTVADDGKGMRYPEKLFKKTDDNRSMSSFGLLAIRTLIKKAGGDISAEKSAESSGLAVTVTLPGKVT